MPKVAVNIRKTLGTLFTRFEPLVKNYRRFIDDLMGDIEAWDSQWSDEGFRLVGDIKVTSKGYGTAWGDQIGGYGYRGNRGFDPPEYAEVEYEYPDGLRATIGATLNLREWAKNLTDHNRSMITDPKAFRAAADQFVQDKASVTMLGKLIRAATLSFLKHNGDEIAEDALHDDVVDLVDAEKDGEVTLDRVAATFQSVQKVWFKVSGTGLQVLAEVNLTVDDPEATISEYEPDYDPDDRWDRYARDETMTTKTAHRPMLAPQGLDARKVSRGEGFMLYLIDAGRNHSKFYEGLMLPNDDGTFRVLLRWGALTDSGFTGRIDGAKFDARNSELTEREAKAVLAKKYRAKTGKGYVDAWKHKLPKGQYPVGLTRDVGFGWGTQDAAFCIPALRWIRGHLSDAQSALEQMQFGDASEHLDDAARLAANRLRSVDSSMAGKIKKNIAHMQGRASDLLAGEIDASAIRNWKTALSRLMSYIDKQLSVCHGKVAGGKKSPMDAAKFADAIANQLAKHLPNGRKMRTMGVVAYGAPERFISLISGVGGAERDFVWAKVAYYMPGSYKQGHGFTMHPRYLNLVVDDKQGKSPAALAREIAKAVKSSSFARVAGITFDPKEIGKVKPPEGDPDELRIVKDTDQRWFSEVADLYPSGTQTPWTGDGKAPESYERTMRLASRYIAQQAGLTPARVDKLASRYLAAQG